ncbi:MAG: hypothetical protein AAB632_01250 [Patescibacteria group bacterium]
MKVGIKKPILLFLGGVLVLSAVLVVLRGIQLPQIPYFNSEKKNKQTSQPKMAALSVQDNKIIIKYSELNLFMAECCDTIVKEIKTEKDDTSVKMTGKATFPFPANFEGNLSPYVENEKIKGRLSNLILGKVESPQMLSGKLEDLINLGFENKINSTYKVKDVKITSEGIIITNYE